MWILQWNSQVSCLAASVFIHGASCQPGGTYLKVLSCLQPFTLSLLHIYRKVTSFVQPFSSPKRICLFINSGAIDHKTTHCPFCIQETTTHTDLSASMKQNNLSFILPAIFLSWRKSKLTQWLHQAPSLLSQLISYREDPVLSQDRNSSHSLLHLSHHPHTTLSLYSLTAAERRRQSSWDCFFQQVWSLSLTWDLMEGSLSLKKTSSNRSREKHEQG